MRNATPGNGRRNGLQLVKNVNRSSASLVLGLFLMAGAIAIQASHADTAVINSEAELGTTGGKAQKIASGVTGASGGGIVTFGSGAGGGGGGGGGTGGGDGEALALCTPALCDPRMIMPDTLFTAKDGSNNYMRSVIPDNPRIDPNSAAMMASRNNVPKLNGPVDWQMGLYASTNADPLSKPSVTMYQQCNIGTGLHVPDFAIHELGDDSYTDGWLMVANTDEGTATSLYQSEKNGNSWTGGCGGQYKLNGNGTLETGIGVGTGADVQAGFGFILHNELNVGVIDHALYFTGAANVCNGNYRKPASKSDGGGSGSGCIPMGARMQLDPSVNCDGLSGASKGEIMICKAMIKYGGYMLDSGGPGNISGIGIQGDDMNDPGRSVANQTPGNNMRADGPAGKVGLTGNPLNAIPWDKLRVLAQWDGK